MTNFSKVSLPFVNVPSIAIVNVISRVSPASSKGTNKVTFNDDGSATIEQGVYSLFANNIKVSLEDYKIKEDAKNGFDLLIDIRLKQYRDYGTTTRKMLPGEGWNWNYYDEKQRPTESAPEYKTYTVEKGDALWLIAKKVYGNGSLYPKIYEANKEKITNPNLLYPGQVLVIP